MMSIIKKKNTKVKKKNPLVWSEKTSRERIKPTVLLKIHPRTDRVVFRIPSSQLITNSQMMGFVALVKPNTMACDYLGVTAKSHIHMGVPEVGDHSAAKGLQPPSTPLP